MVRAASDSSPSARNFFEQPNWPLDSDICISPQSIAHSLDSQVWLEQKATTEPYIHPKMVLYT